MRSEARLSPEAEHTVWWLLLCRAVERAARAAAEVERDALRRERDAMADLLQTTRAEWERVRSERDAAMALLSDFRAMAGKHWGAHPLRARTDALLGNGGGEQR